MSNCPIVFRGELTYNCCEVILMDLYKELLIEILRNEEINITFPNITLSCDEIVSAECYKAMQKIKHIVQDDSLDDKECFAKIEAIVILFETLGIDSGNRHDFG